MQHSIYFTLAGEIGQMVEARRPLQQLLEAQTRLQQQENAAQMFVPTRQLRESFALSSGEVLYLDLCIKRLLAGEPLPNQRELSEVLQFLQEPAGGVSPVFAPNFQGGCLHPQAEDFLLEKTPRLPQGVQLDFGSEETLYHDAPLLSELRLFFQTVQQTQLTGAGIVLRGSAGSGRRFLLSRLASECGCTLLLVDGAQYTQDAQELMILARLYQSLICFSPCGAQSLALAQALQDWFRLLLFVQPDGGQQPLPEGRLLVRTLAPFTHNQRAQVIAQQMGETFEARTLAAYLPVFEPQIGQLLAVIARLQAESLACAQPQLSAQRVRAVVRQAHEASLSDYAQPLRTNKMLADVVLPAPQKQQLENLCSFAKIRGTVLQDWGFAEKIPYGHGISALFYGASGTGKTLAASAIANELGMTLYRVDLSQLISKYIGETQKNIGRIFDDAQKCSCILFFDEADALFARRGEVGETQNKYANAETAYLLQRTEQYNGVILMATNLKEAQRRRGSCPIRRTEKMREESGFSVEKQKESAAHLAALYEKYHLPAQALEEDRKELERFRVTVPVVGAFNTGKSSLLNALLQFRVLPTAITDSTTVPTEIVYGENNVTVYRGGARQQVGVQELRNPYFDLEQVSMLRLAFQSPFLQRIHSVKLVDMPGLDSGSSVDDTRIYSYLANSLAAIMVFSADEPVIKESVSEFLARLRILNIPMFVVLSKCDKVPQEDLEQATRFLRRSIARQMETPEPEIYCVCVKGEAKLEPMYQILDKLQAQADEILVQVMGKRFAGHRQTLQFFLQLRRQGLALSISELDAQAKALQECAQWMSGLVERQQAAFADSAAQCVARMLDRLKSCLAEAALPIETMLAAAQDPTAYVDGVLRGAVSAGVSGELIPALKGYFREMVWVLQMQNLLRDEAAGELQDAAIRSLNDMAAALTAPAVENSGALPSVHETMLNEICSSAEWLTPILHTLDQPGNRKKRPQIAHDAVAPLIETLLDACRHSLEKGVACCTHQMRQTVGAMLEQSGEMHKAALHTLRAEKAEESSRALHTREELQQDLDWVLAQSGQGERDVSDVI